MNTVVHNCRWSIKSCSLVYESDPLRAEETRGNRNRENEDAAMLKHPWNQINEPSGSRDGVTNQQMQNHGRREGVLLSVMEMWTYSKKQPQQNERETRMGPEQKASNSGSHCDALASEENKRGWEKWASRCDSLFLQPPWHHLLTAGMCSIIFINIGESHSWQI